MATEADRIANGLRMTTNRIGTLISAIRGDGRRGRDATARAAEYLGQMRRNYANIAAGKLVGLDVSAFEKMAPLPYVDGLMGLSEERKRARQWLGVRECLNLPAVEPFHFLEAAE